jgi:hypothetical protein
MSFPFFLLHPLSHKTHRHDLKNKKKISEEFHSQQNLLMIVGDNVREILMKQKKTNLISSYEYKSTHKFHVLIDRISKLKQTEAE